MDKYAKNIIIDYEMGIITDKEMIDKFVLLVDKYRKVGLVAQRMLRDIKNSVIDYEDDTQNYIP